MANIYSDLQTCTNDTIEHLNELGFDIPETLLDLLNKLPYSACDQYRFGPDVIATICGLHSVYGEKQWRWGMDLTQEIRNAAEEYDLLDKEVGDLSKYEYFGVNAGEYIGEFVETGDDVHHLTIGGLCNALCWLGGWEEEEKAYEE